MDDTCDLDAAGLEVDDEKHEIANQSTRGELCLLFIHPGASLLIFPAGQRHYRGMISSFLCWLISAFKTRRSLALENLALRQQLAVLHRSAKRPRLSDLDRGFWVLLRRIWTDWHQVLVIVKP